MTQHKLITEYIKEHGSILPAKCYGLVYKDQMLGSETSKRCRELRAKGVLRSEQDGKFERFYLNGLSLRAKQPEPYVRQESSANLEVRTNFKVDKWLEQWKKPEVTKTATLF